jgi:hypothetical protein
MKQGDKTTMSAPRTRFQNPNSGASAAKGTPSTPSGGGKNLFGGAGDKAAAIKQAGPKAPKPAFKPTKAPLSSPPAVGKTARDLAKAQGQANVKAAQTRRTERNLAESQRLLRNSTIGKAASAVTGLRGYATQAIAESVAPRPTASYASLAAGKAKAAATIKAKAKSADSFGGQYQKAKAGAKPKAAPKMSKAKSFDNAFASARNSGMKTFTWEGKRYTTKMK